MKKILSFLVDDVDNWSVVSDRKSFYHTFGKKEDTNLTHYDIKKYIRAMPEYDQLAFLGVSQNQCLIRCYNETKDVLKGLSGYF